jgi:FkbM family methyltransferase
MIERKHIKPLLLKIIDKVFHLRRWGQFQKVLTAYAARTEDFFFIEIGANDGKMHDFAYQHVQKHHWRGILVEPVGYYFERLKQHYAGNKNLILENAAIADQDGTRVLYRVKEGLSYLPAWANGLGTFRQDVLLKHGWAIPDIHDCMVKEEVRCMTLASLLKKHAVDRVDLLLIDTEGYDYEIIKQIDFQKVAPKIIVFEHKHLSAQDRADCEALLNRNRYVISRHYSNTMAYVPVE